MNKKYILIFLFIIIVVAGILFLISKFSPTGFLTAIKSGKFLAEVAEPFRPNGEKEFYATKLITNPCADNNTPCTPFHINGRVVTAKWSELEPNNANYSWTKFTSVINQVTTTSPLHPGDPPFKAILWPSFVTEATAGQCPTAHCKSNSSISCTLNSQCSNNDCYADRGFPNWLVQGYENDMIYELVVNEPTCKMKVEYLYPWSDRLKTEWSKFAVDMASQFQGNSSKIECVRLTETRLTGVTGHDALYASILNKFGGSGHETDFLNALESAYESIIGSFATTFGNAGIKVCQNVNFPFGYPTYPLDNNPYFDDCNEYPNICPGRYEDDWLSGLITDIITGNPNNKPYIVMDKVEHNQSGITPRYGDYKMSDILKNYDGRSGNTLHTKLFGAIPVDTADPAIPNLTIDWALQMADYDALITDYVSDAVFNSDSGIWRTELNRWRGTDVSSPSQPSGLSAVPISSSQINLTWSASTDNIGVVGYRIYQNGSLRGTVTNTSYPDVSLSPNTTYTYTVSAYDAATNESAQSVPPVSATTQAVASPSPTTGNPKPCSAN